jgi:xanthine dehydrogenase accessory factor
MNPYRRIVESIDSGQSFAVGLVLDTEGSTPREAGTRAVIEAGACGEAGGHILGTVGGGAVEAETQRRAVLACQSRRPAVFDVDLTGARAGGDQPVCGGRMRLLVDPTAAKDQAAFAQAALALEQRRRGVLLTVVHVGEETRTEVQWQAEEEVRLRVSAASAEHAKPEVGAAPLPSGLPDADAVRACLAAETPRLFTRVATRGASLEILVEPVVPNPLLLIVGGGHVGQALAAQAALIGFDLTVLDDRPEFTDPNLFPEGTMTRCGELARELSTQPVGPDTYIAIVTHSHQQDAEALRACLRRPAAYVGMIGSRRKVALIRQSLIESGAATEEEFDRVFAPIGLDLGAETVPEIAASIVAQIITVRRTGRAGVAR